MQEADAMTLDLVGDTPQPQRETKEERFVRLAPGRVNRVLDSIRIVGHLANRSDYAYQQEDVEAILQAMRTAVNDVESRFRSNSPRQEFMLRR